MNLEFRVCASARHKRGVSREQCEGWKIIRLANFPFFRLPLKRGENAPVPVCSSRCLHSCYAHSGGWQCKTRYFLVVPSAGTTCAIVQVAVWRHAGNSTFCPLLPDHCFSLCCHDFLHANFRKVPPWVLVVGFPRSVHFPAVLPQDLEIVGKAVSQQEKHRAGAAGPVLLGRVGWVRCWFLTTGEARPQARRARGPYLWL